MSQLHLAIYPNFEQADVSLSEWQALLKKSAARSIFLTPEFLLTALEHIPYRTEKAKTLVIRTQHDNELIGLFFFRNTRSKWKLLQFNMAEYTVVDEVDQPYPIIHKQYETQAWQLVLEYFLKYKKDWDIFDFMELPPQSPIYQVVANTFKFPFFAHKQSPDTSGPVVDLSQNWDVFAAQHKKMRKKIRKMEKDFAESFEFRYYSGPDCKKYLDDYLQLEKKSWKGQQNIGIAKNAQTIQFYQHFFAQLAKQNALCFGFIYINSQLISGEIAYADQQTIYFAHGSYDPDYQKYSPGMVSTALLIKTLCGKQYQRGDFLTGFASYINPWAKEFTQTKRLTLFKLTPRMVFVLILVAIKKFLWRILKKPPTE